MIFPACYITQRIQKESTSLPKEGQWPVWRSRPSNMQYDRIMPDRTVVTHPTSPWLQNETTESPLDHQLYLIVLSDIFSPLSDISSVTLPKAQPTLSKDGRQNCSTTERNPSSLSWSIWNKKSKHAFRLSKNMLWQIYGIVVERYQKSFIHALLI